MAEPVWVPVSTERLAGQDVLVRRRLTSIFGYEKLEAYLEEMSAKGWHLHHNGPGWFDDTFVLGIPGKVRYYLDYGYANWREYFQKMLDFSPRPWIKCQPYEGDRPEDRKALLSQMIQYRSFQFLYGFMLFAILPSIGSTALGFLSMLGRGGTQAFSFESDLLPGFFQILSSVIHVAITVMLGFLGLFFLFFVVFLLVTIVIMQVKHNQAKQRLSRVV